MRTLKTLVLILPLLMMLILARPSAAESLGSWKPEEVKRILDEALAEDRYTLMVSVYRDSTWDREVSWPADEHLSMHEKIQWGPMDISVKLVPFRHTGNYPLFSQRLGLARYIVRREGQWRILDYEKETIEKLDEWEEDTEIYERYKALKDAMPDLERRLKAIDAYAVDARCILRLLQGIVFYEYVRQPYSAHMRKIFQVSLPISGPVQVRFSGAQWRGQERKTKPYDPIESWWSAEAKAEPWSANDVERERNWRIDRGVHAADAFVWRFRPEDMARVRALIADLDAVKKALFEEGFSETQTTPDGQRHEQYNRFFWEPFLNGLRQVVTFAWALSPHRPPENMFTDDLALVRLDSAPTFVNDWILKSDAPLVLPPIVGDTLMRLQMPQWMIDNPPPEEKISVPVTYHEVSKERGQKAYEDTKTISFTVECPSSVRYAEPDSIEAPGDSDTQWTRQPHKGDRRLDGFLVIPRFLVSTDTSDEDFRGEISIVWRLDRKLHPTETGYRTEDHRYTYRWVLEHVGPTTRVAPGAAPEARP